MNVMHLSLVLQQHCKEILIYVFPEKELLGLSPNCHIHVSVSDIHIPTIGPSIFLQQNRQPTQKHECRNWVGTVFLFWEYLFRMFYIVSLQCSFSSPIAKHFEKNSISLLPLLYPYCFLSIFLFISILCCKKRRFFLPVSA
jgi:hypothetical protein